MTLHSIGIELDSPRTVFKSLEKYFDQKVTRLSAGLNLEV